MTGELMSNLGPYLIIGAYLAGIVLFGVALWLDKRYQDRRKQ